MENKEMHFNAAEILVMKAKDFSNLIKKTITDKNGKKRTVWVAKPDADKGSHPSSEHAQGVEMYNRSKKYMSKANAKAQVERHYGKDVADYASGETAEGIEIKSAYGDREYNSESTATSSAKKLNKPENHTLSEYNGKYIITTNSRAKQFSDKSSDFKVIGKFDPNGEMYGSGSESDTDIISSHKGGTVSEAQRKAAENIIKNEKPTRQFSSKNGDIVTVYSKHGDNHIIKRGGAKSPIIVSTKELEEMKKSKGAGGKISLDWKASSSDYISELNKIMGDRAFVDGSSGDFLTLGKDKNEALKVKLDYERIAGGGSTEDMDKFLDKHLDVDLFLLDERNHEEAHDLLSKRLKKHGVSVKMNNKKGADEYQYLVQLTS